MGYKIDPEEDIENTYQFEFNDYFSLAENFGGFEIEPINREASILEIKIKGNNTQKSVDFLNMLTSVYLQQSLEKKNIIATNTIRFIDNQLGVIRDTLELAEMNLQEFQSSRDFMDRSQNNSNY